MADQDSILQLGAFLGQLADKSNHVYWLSSPDFEKIQYISPAYEKIWGRKVDELYKNPEKWITFLHPDDTKNHHPIVAMKERIEKLGPSARYREDYRIIRPDGSIRWIMDRGFPIYDENGVCCGVSGVALDATKEKEYENALAKAKNAAEAANRAKTEFLANISHDMLSPLAGILLAADTINQNKELLPEVAEMSAMISAAGKQLKRFFTSCLDLSKLEMEEWATATSVFSPRQLIHDIYELYLPKAKGTGLSLSIICDPNLPEAVEGHHDSLYRALLNLTGNALKFTKKGFITLRASCGEKVNNDRTTIVLEVEDTGTGIPEDKFKIIFEKLQRLTPSYSSNIEGSGIGLYIVDQFIKRMGGHIQVESEVGKGSKFTVSVPMKIAHTAPTHRPNAPLKPETAAPILTTP